jgi:pimeloyl-ACP methyl ester carboxylesterase
MVGCPTWPSARGHPWWCSRPSPPSTPNPTGQQRRFYLRPLAPLARHFTVYLVNRKPGLRPGSTIADLAADYAQALERTFNGPVAIMGISTGGSIAQQFAIDHPELVDRLSWSPPPAG